MAQACPPLPKLTDGTAGGVLLWAADVVSLYKDCRAKHAGLVQAWTGVKMYGLNPNDLFFIDQCCRWNAHYWVLFGRRDWERLHRAETETANYRKMRQM